MKHLTILVPEIRNNIVNIAAIYEIFETANELWEKNTGVRVFNIQLAGNSNNVQFGGGLFNLTTHVHINHLEKTDLIIMPSIGSKDYQIAVKENQALIEWSKIQYGKGAEIAGMCTGVFMLAESGLLDGKVSSTHWSAADSFRAMFPKIDLKTDFIITDESGLYTNGGAYSFLNLAIYLVEKYYDRLTAIHCAKIFQIDIERQSQSPFIIFTSQRQHGDDMIRRAQEYIELHLTADISTQRLSDQFASSKRNFDRRFLKATGNTPLEYLQRVRIESAKKDFERSNKSVSEIAYSLGYSSPKAFRKAFKRITGLGPNEYRRKYNKMEY